MKKYLRAIEDVLLAAAEKICLGIMILFGL